MYWRGDHRLGYCTVIKVPVCAVELLTLTESVLSPAGNSSHLNHRQRSHDAGLTLRSDDPLVRGLRDTSIS